MEAEARAGEYLAEPSSHSAPDAALSLQAPHLPGARSSWRQLLADKGAKCSAQVQHGEGGLRGNKKGIEDTGLELCRVCGAADTPQVHFPFGAKREGFHFTDGRPGLEFSLVVFKGFIGALL